MNSRATKNPLVRDGVAQQQRSGKALSPNYVQLDETELADFLVFAYHLSEHFVYFDRNLQGEENWQAFFERSTPVQIARIIKTRSQDVQTHYEAALNQLLNMVRADGEAVETLDEATTDEVTPDEAPSTPLPLAERLAYEQQQLDALEDLLLIYEQILSRFQGWFQGLDRDTSLTGMIQASIKTSLPHILRQIYQLDSELGYSRQVCSFERHLILQDLLEAFSLQHLPPRPVAKARPPMTGSSRLSPFLQDLFNSQAQMKAQADGIFQPLFQAFTQIVDRAEEALEQSLHNERQNLPPHLALYVAFWKILQPARDDLNQMTKRHLDFFYREVLRLAEKEAQPDRAHVVLTLDKSQQAHKLAGKSQFSAGNDETGVERIYTLDEEIIVNLAQVAELKGLFLHRADSPSDRASGAQNKNNTWGLYASPQVNSADGLGGEFPPDPDPSEPAFHAWLPFGDSNRPIAAVGLAISSPVLALASGDRTILFTLTLGLPHALTQQSRILTDSLIEQINASQTAFFQLSFSGESEWIDVEPKIQLSHPDKNVQIYQLTIEAKLPAAIAAVVPYNSDNLPGEKIGVSGVPVAKLSLGKRKGAVHALIDQATLQDIAISVAVEGARNLLLQNDLTVLDATKPFAPFGPQPKVGSRFYLGSSEILSKALTDLKISFELESAIPNDGTQPAWGMHYAAYYGTQNPFVPGQLSVHSLQHRKWHPTSEVVSIPLFPDSQPQDFLHYTLDLTAHLTALKPDDELPAAQAQAVSSTISPEPLVPLTHESQSGFLRFQLTGRDFGHTDYPTVLARQVLASAQPIVPGDTPVRRQAVIGAFYEKVTITEEIITEETTNDAGAISEKVVQAKKQTIDDPSEEVTYVPLLPKEPYTPVITALSVDYSAQSYRDNCQLFHLYPFGGSKALPSNFSGALLPLFENEGELLIGLENLVPTMALSLLFQLAEETANTEIKRATVKWHYLHDNDWKRLEDHLILKDETKQLIHSGIVKLSIPDDISNANTTILRGDLHWLRVSVKERSGAIARILSIQSQAASVTFHANGSDPNHLAAPLPPDQVVKLVDAQPEIKQIQQPYASFGGQVKEQPEQFYTRISEHLRHKGRAVTIFDYERIVLERFPDIYKVRCVNHGQAIEGGQFREIAPGHITLAVIPALVHQAAANDLALNDLEPKVNINRLADIEKYLKSISSPWASIQVVNPKYEVIRVKFGVALLPQYSGDFAFYRRQLQRDIIRFLSPWAASDAAEIHFGGEIYRSSILKFVEEHPVVDYVLNFELYQDDDDSDRPRVSATTPHSILVSVPFQDPLAATSSTQRKGHEIYKVKRQVETYRPNTDEGNTLGHRVLSDLTLAEFSEADSARFDELLTSGE
ncbi:MAG: hypothetical protein AB8B99_17870 [Phormidesmis sp.]